VAQLSHHEDPEPQIAPGAISTIILLKLFIFAALGAKIYITVSLKNRPQSMSVQVGESSRERKENDLPVGKIIIASSLLTLTTLYIIARESGIIRYNVSTLPPFELIASLLMNVVLMYLVLTAKIMAYAKKKLLETYPFSLIKPSRIAPERRQEP